MTQTISREFINLLLAKIDIVDVVAHLHVPLQKKSSNNYFARCPFHQEKSASFSVSQQKQFFYCFGCGAGGNAIDFLMRFDHLTFPEAVAELAKKAGMEISASSGFMPQNHAVSVALYELMEQVCVYFYKHMCASDRAIHYLKNRGISGEIVKKFSIGYAENSFHDLLNHFGKNKNEIEKLLTAGLIIKKNDGSYCDRFRDRIIFPINDYKGRIIGFGGRLIDQGEPKYLNSPETILFQKGHELYGFYQASKELRASQKIIIVEGYMDVIALNQYEINNVVATLGTATTPHHIKKLLRYTTDIIFCFDGDQAGRTAAWRALHVVFPLMQDQLNIRFLFLPEGEDPDSLIRKEGKAAFEKRLEQALPLSDFFFQSLAQHSDMATMEGRAKFAASALIDIKTLPAGFYQQMMMQELSKRARIETTHLNERLAQPPINKNSTQHQEPSSSTLTPLSFHPSIRLAAALLIQHPHLVGKIQEPLPKNEEPSWRFMSQLIDIMKENKSITTGELIEYFRETEEEPLIAQFAEHNTLIPDSGIEQAFVGVIRQLQVLVLENEINYLLTKASQNILIESEKLHLSGLIARKKALSNI